MSKRKTVHRLVVLFTAIFIILGFLTIVPALASSPTHTNSVLAVPLTVPSPYKGGGSTHGGGHGGGGGGSLPPAPTSSPPYSPSQIYGAYNFNPSYTGTGETIAIIDAYGSPTIANDVGYFDAQYNLPAINLQIVKLGNHVSKNAGWALETSLDVEWAHAMAPSANIVLIETASASSSSLITTAVNYAYNTTHANVISMSWGLAESQISTSSLQSYDSTFQFVSQHGVILVAASGDNGANDGTSSSTVNYPAASPYVVGVGGTSLNIVMNSGTPTYAGEYAWNSSGGGVSSYFSEPTYQSANGITLSGRGVPDVSYDANPSTGVWVYDTTSYDGSSGWIGVGGTSAGAPQWSAIFADAQQLNPSLNGANVLQSLYSIYNSPNYGNAFHDVTVGYNGAYSASSGYDEVTGIGTPNVSNLLTLL